MNAIFNFSTEPFEFESDQDLSTEVAQFGENLELEKRPPRRVPRPQLRAARSGSKLRPQTRRPHTLPIPRPPRPQWPRRRWPRYIGGGGLVQPVASEFVRWVQHSLNLILGMQLPVNGIMTPQTRSAIRTFQEREGLPADGIVGPDTKDALLQARKGATPSPSADDQPADKEWEAEEAFETYSSNQPVLRRGSTGSAVRDLQNQLTALGFSPGTADGIFGSMTEQAVKTFQRSRGLVADGIVGPQTWVQLYAQPGSASPQPAPAASPVSGEPQVTISSNALVSNNAISVLKDILRLAGLSRATITSGRRTPADQARIMYDLIERNGVAYAKTLYASTGDQVIDVYSAQKSAGKSSTAIKQAMEAKINQLGCQYVSHHCSNTHDVFDVAPSSIADQKAFTNALATALKNGMIDKYITPPTDPAYHIEIILNPTANELMSRILRSPPLPLDAFSPDEAQFEID